MTDATVKHQGKTKRRRERLEVPQAADSSSRSSSSSESSTDTEMSLVAVCTILGVNADVSKQDRATVKPVAVAEGREGDPVFLDLTKWDFSKCRLPEY